MDPESILRAVKDTYLGFQSYADVGTVDMIPPIGKTNLEFKMYFVRPAQVRFEWRDWHPYFGKDGPANENGFCFDGKSVRELILGKQRQAKSLSNAVAGATGVSSGSVLQILKLLYPDCVQSRHSWFEMRDARRLADEEISGRLCYHLVGTIASSDDEEAWISQDDFIVRRLLHRTEVSEKDTERANASALQMLRSMGIKEKIPMATGPQSYHHQFNYNQVVVNKPILDELFTSMQ